MDAKDIKGMTVEEINEMIAGEQGMLQKLKFSHAISPIENPMKIRQTRRILARLKTELHARELAEINGNGKKS
ncbi:MAG: 50S ribosomal protein L29 [Cytophagales bacterium]|nr:50S ribosomal protein L29 [Hyphobacterium sp. CCMP332]